MRHQIENELKRGVYLKEDKSWIFVALLFFLFISLQTCPNVLEICMQTICYNTSVISKGKGKKGTDNCSDSHLNFFFLSVI